MAIQQKLSEVIDIKLDIEQQPDGSTVPVLELEFKFFRYRLVLDDQEVVRKLRSFIDASGGGVHRVKDVSAPKLPRFSKEDR